MRGTTTPRAGDLPAVLSRIRWRAVAAGSAMGTRRATWRLLPGALASMATVIIGSLAGPGALLQAVPIVGDCRVSLHSRDWARRRPGNRREYS